MARGQGARRRRSAKRATMRAVRPGVGKAPAQDSLAAAVASRAASRLKDSGRDFSEDFAASGSTSLPLGDRNQTWDATAADKAVREWAGATDAPNAKYASAFFFKDGDGSKFGDYKLGFAQPVDGTLTANWGGLTAVAGALQGARGGVDIPDADKAAIKTKVEGYYKKAAIQYKDDKIKVPWASDDAKAAAHSLAYAQLGPDANPVLFAISEAIWSEAFAPVDPAKAKPGDLVWDDEDGFMDLISDLSSLLGPGVQIVDVALSADRAIVCDWRGRYDDDDEAPDGEYDADDNGGTYWLVPFSLDANREPVLSDRPEWVQVEEGWVKTASALAVVPLMQNGWVNVAADTLAAGSVCAICSHPAGMHEDTDEGANLGVCSSPGCDCEEYAAKSAAEATATVYSTTPIIFTNSATGTSVTFTFDPATFADESITESLPEQHQPGERIPRRRPSPGTPTPPAMAAEDDPMKWSAVLAPEGKLTSDGRAFAPGSITWPRLDDGPLTLMAMTETSEGGHVGAEVCGRIDRIWRDDTAGLIRAEGVFDTGEYGQEIARLVNARTLRGVSVDLAVQQWDRSPKGDWFDEDGNWAPKPDGERTPLSPLDMVYGEDLISVVLAAEIGMTTVCPFQAFKEAQIAVGDSLVASSQSEACWTVTSEGEWFVRDQPAAALTAAADCGCDEAETDVEMQPIVVTASAAGLVPDRPPADWFANPMLDGPTALTVDEEGRVYGHAAVWEINGRPACHIGITGRCQTPPHSNTDYRFFHLGEVLCDGDERVPCGQITIDTGHADRDLRAADATAHYDLTGAVAAHVAVGEDEYGIWVAGALQPDAPEEKVRLLRGAKLSGDWRIIDGNLELVALLAVNVPGFPVPRAEAAVLVASGEDGDREEMLSLVAAGMLDDALSDTEVEQMRALAALDEFRALGETAE